MLALSFKLEVEARIQSLNGCGNAIGKVAYLKSARIVNHKGKHFHAPRMLIVGEHGGSSFPNVLLHRHPALQQRIASML